MKTKIVIFFALVSCFRVFAEDYANCYYLKNQIYSIASTTDTLLFGTAEQASLIISENRQLGNSGIIFNAADSILEDTLDIQRDLARISAYADSIPCDTNDTCSVDLEPLYNVVSNIYEFVSLEYAVLTNCEDHLMYIRIFTGDVASALSPQNANSIVGSSSFSPDYWVNVKYPQLLMAVSNFNNDVSYSLGMVTNRINYLQQTVLNFYNSFQTFQGTFTYCYTSILSELTKLTKAVNDNFTEVISYLHYLEYLQYLEGISQDIAYLSSNEYFNVNVNNLSNFFVATSASAFRNSSYYYKSSDGDPYLSPHTPPYNNAVFFNRAGYADTVRGGFMNLMSAVASLNNYLCWMFEHFPTNNTDLSEITTGLANLTNILNRVDDYVLGDFSNQFYHVFECIDTLVSNSFEKVDYTTNLVEITQQLYTNNNYLASIDSKLDVLDYIKILSDTPLADYSGDIDYFDYLTNLYLSGVSSSGASTNWFERMEILLASLVFGDSDGTNDIPQSVEMQGFDTDRVSDTMSDFAFSEDFSTSVDNLSQTSRNFMQVLNGYSSALHAVSAPATVSIGTGGIDGSDTSSFEDMMHGHFQVSFNTGTSDRFTVVVRAVTTMSWVLLTMIFIWHCGFWILQKIQFLYRLMRLLINSIWLKS